MERPSVAWGFGVLRLGDTPLGFRIFGMGRLQPLIDDPTIENIEVNGYDQEWNRR